MIFFSVKSEFETLVQVIITNGEKEGGGGGRKDNKKPNRKKGKGNKK
jgi:hypothetical protein